MAEKTTRNTLILARQMRKNPTPEEAALWEILRLRRLENLRFRRQHPIGPFIADFCAPREKLVIEVDGNQHLDQEEYDTQRSAYLESKGYCVLRFWNHQILQEPDTVIQKIIDTVEQRRKPPS